MMRDAEAREGLRKAGWTLYRVFDRWTIYSKKREGEDFYDYINGIGYDFMTVFKNGRKAKGFVNP